MELLKILCPLIVFLVLHSSEAKMSYTGYKLLRALPETDMQLMIIQQLRNLDREKVIVLDDHTVPGKPVSIVVNPNHVKGIEHTFLRSGMEYELVYEDLEQVLLGQISNRKHSSGEQLTFDFSVYHTLQEIEGFLFETAANNSDIAVVQQIGFSYEGRPIYAIHLSTDFEAGRKAVWLDGGIHAREWIAPATMVYFIDQIINLYRTGNDDIITNVLNGMDIYIMAVFNVDGYEYSITDDRLWRKTRSPNVGFPYCPGTDPNRNWDNHWGEVGVSPNPCSDQYPGPGAFSEQEVRSVADFVSKHNIVLYMAYHNCGQFYLTPYGYTFSEAPDFTELMDILDEAIPELEAVHGFSYTYDSLANLVGLNAGSSADYTYGELGIVYSFGVELRDLGQTCFELPEDQIIPNAEENFAALRIIMNRVLTAES